MTLCCSVMDDGTLENLLHSNEGTSLDFKAKQYRFIQAGEEAKTELLKDILAFANAWRTETAYILVGVKEVKGGRSEPIGLGDNADDLDDAQLQQFVSSKTNTPVEFSYGVYQFESQRIGIFTIPKQTRPIWLKADYGKLRRKIVYYRNGSSTDEADPGMIAKMIQADTSQQLCDPAIKVEWADVDAQRSLGDCVEIQSAMHAECDEKWPGAAPTADLGGGHRVLTYPQVNNNYWRELGPYLWASAMMCSIDVVLSNTSNRLAKNVRLNFILPKKEGIFLMPKSEFPSKPRYRDRLMLPRPTLNVPGLFGTEMRDLEDRYEIEIGIGSIQPKAKSWATAPFCLGSNESRQAEFTATVYADNIGEPQRTTLSLNLEVEQRPALTMDDLRAFRDHESHA